MPLPSVQKPTYPIQLPSNPDTKIHFRPFTVKEENMLLMAKEESGSENITNAVKQIISNCTENTVDPNTLTSFDVEYLFVKIRAKSVGEKLDLLVPCTSCEERNRYLINLEDLEVHHNEDHRKQIQLTDSVGVIMEYPTISTMEKFVEEGIDRATDDPNKLYKAMLQCMDSIYTEDEMYSLNEVSDEEAMDWIQELTSDQRNKILQFFETMPELREEIQFTCHACGHENEITLRGLQSFFE